MASMVITGGDPIPLSISLFVDKGPEPYSSIMDGFASPEDIKH